MKVAIAEPVTPRWWQLPLIQHKENDVANGRDEVAEGEEDQSTDQEVLLLTQRVDACLLEDSVHDSEQYQVDDEELDPEEEE